MKTLTYINQPSFPLSSSTPLLRNPLNHTPNPKSYLWEPSFASTLKPKSQPKQSHSELKFSSSQQLYMPSPNHPTHNSSPISPKSLKSKYTIYLPHLPVHDTSSSVFQQSATLPSDNKRSQSTLAPVKNFALQVPNNSDNKYLVNSYSIPKLLVATKKKKNMRLMLKNRAVCEFMQRFENPEEKYLNVRSRKGFSGWKLIRANRSLVLRYGKKAENGV